MKGLSAHFLSTHSLLMVVIPLAGCGDVGEAPAFEARDSAGVPIVESYRPSWIGPAGGWGRW